MADSWLDSIMSQVQQLPANEQLQLIKRVADLLGCSDQLQHIEERLAAMAADPNIQHKVEQTEAESQPPPNDIGEVGTANGEAQRLVASLPSGRASARTASLRDSQSEIQRGVSRS